MTRKYFLLLFFIVLHTVCYAQIKGRITDADSGLPIANANVYLNGTYKGTTSNKEGLFSLNSTEKNVPLIVTYVGYASQTITSYAGKTLNIALKPQAKQLHEVTIGADDMSREAEMRIFLTEFIGSASKDCIISNPDDIYFTYRIKNDSLTANSDKPLIIQNKKLGYKITYFLTYFKHVAVHTTYQGNYFFEEDTAGLQSKEIKKIVKAREDAYFGSRMHFIRALWADKIKENDFKLYILDKQINYNDIIKTRQVEKYITLSMSLTAKDKAALSDHAPTLIINYKGQTSNLRQPYNETETFITANGFYEPNELWTGEMATQRVNQLLPFEYEPANYVAAEPVTTPRSTDSTLNRLIASQDTLQTHRSAEKLYLQLDKNTYGLRDTLWFKAYLFNASTLQASAKSNIVYIEISDESNIVQVRQLVVLANGLGSGSIVLNKRDFPEGGYTLRAYTQWMRNFDESAIFKKQFLVDDINKNKWLVSYNSAFQNNAAQLHFQLYQTNKQFVSNQLLQLGIKQGDRTLRWDKIQTTTPLGGIDLNIALPNNPEPKYATLQKAVTQSGSGFMGASAVQLDKNAPVYKFPIIYNRAEKTDVQFMPEGGYLVNGINGVVGFKAIGEDGKGVNISGTIVNANNEQLASFKSNTKGMGSTNFTPQAGMSYKAIVNLPGGIKKEYPLPAVKPTGTVLTVTNPEPGDSVTVKITAAPGTGPRYILLGQSRGLVCVAARIALVNNTKTIKVPKAAFASGVVRFTLLNDLLNTLNERIVYIDHHDNLKIKVTTNKPGYAPQDSIALNLDVRDSNDEPVKGAFSISVVDNLQLGNSTNTSSSIATNLLLTSDLKGNIEDPEYYFTGDHQKDLDNLLLTQGWTGFDWSGLFKPEKQPEFAAEPDIAISGKVTNLFDKGVKNAVVNLLSLKPLYSLDVKTDDKGHFILKNIPQIDSAMYIRVRNEKGNASTYGIDLDKREWPTFSKNELQLPWYVNTDTIRLKIADTILRNAERLDNLEGSGGKLLKEVEIKEKKIVNGSHNLNGPGEADQVIDEHDIAKEKPMTLLELLKKDVQGFRTVGIGEGTAYFVYTEPLQFPATQGRGPKNPPGAFIIDGVQVHGSKAEVYYLLNYFTSDDIKGIEVMSKSFTSLYELRFLGGVPMVIFPVPYIEITTGSGNGPYMRKTPADLVYKPIPAVSLKEFYRPIYPVKNSELAAFDTRTTIHWEPNIVTDKYGRATVTFYAAGQPATYTITVEGSNMNGNVGSTTQKITIK